MKRLSWYYRKNPQEQPHVPFCKSEIDCPHKFYQTESKSGEIYTQSLVFKAAQFSYATMWDCKDSDGDDVDSVNPEVRGKGSIFTVGRDGGFKGRGTL